MPTRNLVLPLEDAWQNVIDAMLRERGAPTTSDVRRLAPKVMELSRAYNASLASHGKGLNARALALEARIGFSFARDVPKGAGAVRELVAFGKLAIPQDRPLRIVDVGAGLGAMTWGIARALEAANQSGKIDALFIDEDEAVLSLAKAMANKAKMALPAAPPAPTGKVKLTVRTHAARIGSTLRIPHADLIVIGQTLSELDGALAPDERAARHAAMLAEWLATSVRQGGALVVVEPALRERTRHLHAVREALLAAGKAHIFAPCLHDRSCPVLAAQGQWCHDDLDVDLPTWLAPLARGAGLRWQGLSFSYLVLQAPRAGENGGNDENSLAPTSRGLHLRVISDVMRTKGKVEIFGCTSEGERVRFRRLDRDIHRNNLAWENLRRGDIVTLLPSADAPAHAPIEEGGRLRPDVTVQTRPGRTT